MTAGATYIIRGSYVGAMPSMDRGAGAGGGDGGATALMTMPFHDLERLSAVVDSIPAAKRRLSCTGAMQQTDTNGNNLPPLYYGELTGKCFVEYFLKSYLNLLIFLLYSYLVCTYDIDTLLFFVLFLWASVYTGPTALKSCLALFCRRIKFDFDSI